jgi:glycosyltransferase involved in cell wall biosynthesis
VAGGCSLLAFPSVREFGGGVVLEAMAMGLAPLIVDYAGTGELVTDETGYKVPLGDRDAIISRFRAMLSRLAQDPADVASRGVRAQALVRQNFTWSAKARQVSDVYDWVTGHKAVRPDFSALTVEEERTSAHVAG